MIRQITKPDGSGCRKQHLQQGSSIVEGVIAILLICLILFGLLQVFLLYTAQEFTDYAAFRTARSLSVGFNDSLAKVEARTRAIPVSGKILEPPELSASFFEEMFGKGSTFTTSDYRQNNDVYDYYYRLRRAILHYMEGYRYLECEYWFAGRGSSGSSGGSGGSVSTSIDLNGNVTHNNGNNNDDNISVYTSLTATFRRRSESVSAEVKFEKYPMRLPFAKAFVPERLLDISSTVDLKNHSNLYLER
ncbi:MAG: hypothetical protein IKB25_14445 [Lentisphaeria bacterium]|nr:hypothetical protein [Lentisphaeria bacterium]